MGEVTLATPRDRLGTFEPLLIPKHQRRITGFDEKIIALFAKGLSTRDIQEILEDLYGVEVSATLISEATSAIDEEVTAWRSRPIDPVWPIVYFDGLVVHVRGSNGRVSQHTIYVAIGVNLEGKKELLGLWLSETEGFSFRATESLRPRGSQSLMTIGLCRGHERVLAQRADRPEESRPEGHLRGLHRRADRLPGSDQSGL